MMNNSNKCKGCVHVGSKRMCRRCLRSERSKYRDPLAKDQYQNKRDVIKVKAERRGMGLCMKDTGATFKRDTKPSYTKRERKIMKEQ